MPKSAIRPIPLVLAALLAASCAYADGIKGDAAPGDATKGDPAKGKELFTASACSTCHSVTKDDNSSVGPNLLGVLGRQAGTVKSLIGPSENLKKYGVTWDAQTLDEFLTNPSAKVPGTAMIGILADPQQRADVIAYLATLK